MKPVLKKALWVLALLVAAGLVVYAFLPAAVGVDVMELSRGPIEVTVNEEGRTRVRDRYVISAPLAGNLLRVELRAGDAVAAGETVLAVIQPTRPQLLDARQFAEAEARVRMAQAGVERAVILRQQSAAELEWAASERQRLERLAPQGAVAQTELDEAILLHRVRMHEQEAARWTEQLAQHELELAEAALLGLRQMGQGSEAPGQIVIRAPVDGQVLRVTQESEAAVQPGQALLEIAQVGDLEVVMDVLSREAVRVRPGAAVRLLRWGGDGALAGVVRRVEPSAFTKISALGVEEQRVNVIADFADRDAAQRLGDGFRVDGQIVVDQRSDALRVPVGALFRHGADWAVFTVVEETARLTPVRLGLRGDLDAEVLEGLRDDDRVIIYPSDQIAHGVRVAPR